MAFRMSASCLIMSDAYFCHVKELGRIVSKVPDLGYAYIAKLCDISTFSAIITTVAQVCPIEP